MSFCLVVFETESPKSCHAVEGALVPKFGRDSSCAKEGRRTFWGAEIAEKSNSYLRATYALGLVLGNPVEREEDQQEEDSKKKNGTEDVALDPKIFE